MNAETVKKKIKTLKQLPYQTFSINCTFNELTYKLHLLTAQCEQDVHLMELLGRWRKNNEMWFSAIFKVTTQGTTKWFKNLLIEEEDRLLFMIQVQNQYIGHIGLYRFDFDTMICEIDNIIRGETGYKGIIQNAIAYMMQWGKKNLGIKGYRLQASSKNPRALNLYQRLNFFEEKREPVVCVKEGSRIEWVNAPLDYNPDDYSEENKRDNIYMVYQEPS